jgi:hypothetical protein
VSSEKAGAKPKPRKPKPKPKTEARSLSKAAERNYRIHSLLGLAVKQGYGPNDLMTVAIKGFKVSPTVAARLIADAYELCVQGTSLYDRLRMGAIQVSRMEHVLRASLQAKQLQTALGTLAEINKFILSIDKFERAQQEIGDGGSGSAPLTPEEQAALDREGDF